MKQLTIAIACWCSLSAGAQESPVFPDGRQQTFVPPPIEFSLKPQPGIPLFSPGIPVSGQTVRFEPDRRQLPAFNRNPYALDYTRQGRIASWDTGFAAGSGHRTTLPGLFSVQSADLAVTQQFGNLTLSALLTADRYQLWRGIHDRFGVHGSASYSFSDHVSLTLFGSYHNNSPFLSPAAVPYIGNTGFGGFFTFQGDRFGIDLGAERVYDPMRRSWTTVPIVTPHIRFNDKFSLDLPVGWLIQGLLEKTIYSNDRPSNPTIAPPIPPMPPVR